MKARDHKKIVKEMIKTHEQKMEELKKRISQAMTEETGETTPDNEAKEWI